MCTPSWLNFYALDWNYLPVGREFEGKCLTGADYLSAPVFEKCQTSPSPHMSRVTVLTLKQISGREGNAILINESKQKQTNKKKKQRRFACNYIALVSDFIWSWYAFKNAAEVCIIRHFNKTLVELQQKLNNIKNQCLTKFYNHAEPHEIQQLTYYLKLFNDR